MPGEPGQATVATVPYPKSVQRFPALRQSLLSDFDNCALTSAFSVAYERGWSSHPAARGTIAHRVIAMALRELVKQYAEHDAPADVGRVPVDLVLDDYLPHVLRQHDVPMQSADGLGEDVVCIPLREIAEARIGLKAWAAYTRWTVPNIAGIERRLHATLGYPNEHGELIERVVTGKLDLLLLEQDGALAIVVDWKDTWDIPPESKISEEGYFQQRFYALLVFLFYPRVQRVTLREFYIRFSSGKVLDKQNRPISPVREATVDRYNLGEIIAEMSALVERFDRAHETGRFKTAPGSHCSNCVRPADCPVYPKARREGRIASQQDAETVAGELNVAEAVANRARAALRAWNRNHGPTRVRDAKRPRVFGTVVRRRTRKPALSAIKQALAAGRPLEELYVTEEYPEVGIHSPEEEHPFAKAAREEEEMLLALERREGKQ